APAVRTLAVLSLCAAFPPAAPALISSSGEYQLESSARLSGGGLLSGGEYSSKGASGQISLPAGIGNSRSGAYSNRSGFYNPPHFTFQKGLPAAVKFNSGNAALTLPAGAVDKEAFDITLNDDPGARPLSVDAGTIDTANSKMEANEGAWARLFTGNATEMGLFDEQDFWRKPLLKAGNLSLRYQDDDGDGVLDGSFPSVRVDTIRTWQLDEELAMWTKVPGAIFDKASRTVSVPFMSPGVYSLLGSVDDAVKHTYAFPVPFRPNGPAAGSGAGQSGTEADGITFTNVPQTGDIEIYTLDGRLVRKLVIPEGLPLPKLSWDVRTSGGQRAASGVYIWRVVSGSNSKTGKLMVIW
nr:T9SS type A sorting domain-containing protein [Elusimicrobiota bacterium]